MKRLIVVGIMGACLAAAAWPVMTASRLSRPDKAIGAFQHDAGGRAAHDDATWHISPGQAGMGLIAGVAVCEDEAFLLDRQLGVVHRVDLTRRVITAAIAPPVGRLRFVTSLAADCDHRLLYVVDHDGVASFEIDFGTLIARYSKPTTFVHSLGPAVFDASSQTLAVPGLWPQADSDWLVKPIDRMFEGDRIGYLLDLRTGRASPMLSAVERGCWSLGPNCVHVTLDAVEGSGAARWIAAHRVGMLVGIYDARFRQLGTIDVRSPRFLDTGQRNESHDITDMLAWGNDNSVIRQIHAFGDAVVTIHSVNRTRPQAARTATFDVFLNMHTLGGARILSDLRLPDLPVGRDQTSIYVVDYGSGGRRKMGHGPISLRRISVVQ